jgi:hypothetical protein
MHAPPGPLDHSARQTPPSRHGDEQNSKAGIKDPRQGWDANTPGYQEQNPHGECHSPHLCLIVYAKY